MNGCFVVIFQLIDGKVLAVRLLKVRLLGVRLWFVRY